ncbi:MAG: carbamoyltransferase HypF [Planctomycetota bacterium]
MRGVVQGVGFRPFAARLALGLGLAGSAQNAGDEVVLEVEGEPRALESFLERLRREAPRGARIEELTVQRGLQPLGRAGFEVAVRGGAARRIPLPPDQGPCAACLAEALAEQGRRAGYPFTSCTACGPRVSIARGLPYARENTALGDFPLCAECAREYADLGDRRFHAEAQACPACGPSLELHPAGREGERLRGDAALQRARELLAAGTILALEGVGGWQLACDASDAEAVRRLRARKRRPEQPLAVLVADLEGAARIARVGAAEDEALSSPARPIVLLERRAGAPLCAEVAPGLRELGVMLPASPLHRLLLEPPAPPALVLTSGNLHGSPLAWGKDEARALLAPVAEWFLGHDREITLPLDDSLVRVVGGAPCALRRGRGQVPDALELPVAGPDLIAFGGDLKGALCLVRDGRALLGPHLGDLAVPEVEERAQAVRDVLARLLSCAPEVAVADLHPDYASARLARATGLPLVRVQHHHAHVAAVLAERGLEGPVLAATLDGTGYGTDGTVWGCELLRADLRRAERLGGLLPLPLLGGDAAAREPWRAALSQAVAAGLDDTDLPLLAPDAASQATATRVLRSAAAALPLASSAGRLFDAVAALGGLRARASYEAQVAMELEAAAQGELGAPYPLPLVEAESLLRLDPRPLVREVVTEVRAGADPARVSRRFHAALAGALVEALTRLSATTGLRRVVLAGGCFQNRLLLEATRAGLEARGLEPLSARRFPGNDGGLALGQAAVASALHARRATP